MIAAEKSNWETEVLNPLVTERDELLQYKPKDKTDAEKALEAKEIELFRKEVGIELKANQMDDFSEFFNVSSTDELKGKIEALKKILDARKINGAYKPDDHKQQSAWEAAASKNDVTGMVSAKLSKLFN